MASAAAWLEAVRFEDVMLPCSEWVGEWSDYWGDYAWQPLIGGEHRALSDCRALLERLKEMAPQYQCCPPVGPDPDLARARLIVLRSAGV